MAEAPLLEVDTGDTQGVVLAAIWLMHSWFSFKTW